MPLWLSQCSLLPFGTRVLEFLVHRLHPSFQLAKSWPYFKSALLLKKEVGALSRAFSDSARNGLLNGVVEVSGMQHKVLLSIFAGELGAGLG